MSYFFSKFAGQGQNDAVTSMETVVTLSGEVSGQAPDKPDKKNVGTVGHFDIKVNEINSLACPKAFGTLGTAGHSGHVGHLGNPKKSRRIIVGWRG